MPEQQYVIKLYRDGQQYGAFGAYSSRAAAKKDAQRYADMAGSGVQVYVEPHPSARMNPARGTQITVSPDLLDEWIMGESDTLDPDGASQERIAFVEAIESATPARGKFRIKLNEPAARYLSLGTGAIYNTLDYLADQLRGAYDPEEEERLNALIRELKRIGRRFPEQSFRRNPDRWIQEVDEEIEDKGTAGAFTRQAERAGYDDTLAYARHVIAAYKRWQKRGKQGHSPYTLRTYRRALFAINAQRRANPSQMGMFGGRLTADPNRPTERRIPADARRWLLEIHRDEQKVMSRPYPPGLPMLIREGYVLEGGCVDAEDAVFGRDACVLSLSRRGEMTAERIELEREADRARRQGSLF